MTSPAPTVDPAILDTLAFSGLDKAEMRRRALASRPDLDFFEHKLSFVRRRVVGRDPARPTLVVLPDGPATIESYDAFIEALSDRFNIAVIEIPGFGFSYPLRSEALSFEQTSRIVADALADLDPPRAVLVGPCVQGLIAARVAEMIPDKLAGLIIAQTGDFPAQKIWSCDLLDAQGNLRRPFEGQIKFRLAREKATVDWWTPFVAGPNLPLETFQQEARTVLRSGCCYALASMIQNLSEMEAPELRPAVPTSILWGLADQSHAATDKRSILRYAPDADYAELEGVGHFTDLEAPETIAAEAEKLLQRTA